MILLLLSKGAVRIKRANWKGKNKIKHITISNQVRSDNKITKGLSLPSGCAKALRSAVVRRSCCTLLMQILGKHF